MKTHSLLTKCSARHKGIHRLWHAKKNYVWRSFQQFKNRHENVDLFKSHLLLCQTSTSSGIRNVLFRMKKFVGDFGTFSFMFHILLYVIVRIVTHIIV